MLFCLFRCYYLVSVNANASHCQHSLPPSLPCRTSSYIAALTHTYMCTLLYTYRYTDTYTWEYIHLDVHSWYISKALYIHLDLLMQIHKLCFVRVLAEKRDATRLEETVGDTLVVVTTCNGSWKHDRLLQYGDQYNMVVSDPRTAGCHFSVSSVCQPLKCSETGVCHWQQHGLHDNWDVD